MKINALPAFDDAYVRLPQNVRTKVTKQITFLLVNLRHPSLRAKKYNETRNIWQARVDHAYRFYFKIEEDTYVLTDVIKHKD